MRKTRIFFIHLPSSPLVFYAILLITHDFTEARLLAERNKIINDYHIDTKEKSVITYGLTPEEAIGITERKDYPILTGQDVMLQASYRGAL